MSTDAPTAAPTTHAFQSEVRQVLQLVIHSLYSNKDIVLRELVSNASDACDKLRFLALADAALMEDGAPLQVDIVPDAEARTLTIRDTGIGMGREELVEHLGTIARSGTKAFLEALEAGQKADANLIGQFGVGFYSAFIIADRVEVTSRRAGTSEAWTWASAGDGEFTLAPAAAHARGTSIVLHLREGEDAWLQPWHLRTLVHRYSEHIAFPIRLPAQGEGAEPGAMEAVNQASALWTRPKNELSAEDYQGFYRHLAHDGGEALAWTHNRVEGHQNFSALLYVPARAPFEWMLGGRDERKGLKLYVKRVFIMDAAEQMLPAYLRFVRGVIDSDDLPLNVSREILQHNRQVERIKGALTKRVLDLLERMAREEPEKYATFWDAFGHVLKEGLAEDPANAGRLMGLMRFASTAGEGPAPRTALAEYVARKKVGQDAIYYLTADGWGAAKGSPQLEAFRARGVEVLLLHERIDEWAAQHFDAFESLPLRNISKGELDLSALGEAPDHAGREAALREAGPVLERLKAVLGAKVDQVRASSRLVESPSCLVTGEHDLAPHLQRLLAASGQAMPASAPVLEVNPAHPLLARFGAEADEARAADIAELLLEQAQVAAGAQLEDPAAFLARINRLLLG